MFAFGWTIEYTLALTWPVFLDLFALIKRARLDNAVDAVYTPYCAGKYGKACTKFMLSGRGKWYVEEEPDYSYSEEDLRRAQEVMDRTIKVHDAELAEVASNPGPDPVKTP